MCFYIVDNIPEFVSPRIAHILHPCQRAGSIDNDIVLPSVNEHLGVKVRKDSLNQSCFIFHEIFIQGFPDVPALTVELDILVPLVHVEHFGGLEISIKQIGRVWPVLSHVVDVDVGGVAD